MGVTTSGGASTFTGASLFAFHCAGLRNITEHLLQAKNEVSYREPSRRTTVTR